MNHAPRARTLILLVGLAAPSITAVPALADDTNGIAVCTAAGQQLGPVIVPDGAGGAVIAWHDQRSTVAVGGVCFAQRVNSMGVGQWTANGVQLSTTGDPGDTGPVPASPAIASDGQGGAFVAYGGFSSQPRAQWVSPNGTPLWGSNGVQLTDAPSTMRDLAIVRDINGAGGAIVVWRQDNGANGLSDIYAQKVNVAGAVQWGSSGVAVTSTSMNSETLPVLLSDGTGGAIIAFLGSNGARAQRLSASGMALWGTTVLGPLSNNRRPAIVPDGSGGAVVAWAAGNTGIFAQRVNSLGDRQWNPTNTGVQLSTTGNQCAMVGDGAGGATVVWQDNRSVTNFSIFGQRVNGAGATQWMANGLPVCQETNDQLAPMIVSDGGTGAIVTWFDSRSPASGDDIYAQRIDASGFPEWSTEGEPVSTAPNAQQLPTIAIDGAGGALVTWQDSRNGQSDIYVHHLDGSGQILAVPGENATPWIARAWPNPFFDRVRLQFALPAAATVRLEVFDVRGRCVRTYAAEHLPAGDHELAWDGQASSGRPAGAGLYFLRATGPGVTVSRSVVRLE